MAASPPPFSPHDARRQARDYARLQRDQARAQRHYWRSWSGYRRSSIVGPCVLLTIGIVALLLETGHLNWGGFWNWYARWWPVLLIGVGVLSLAEYVWDRNDPYAGRRSVGGVVFLILILAFTGWGTHSAHFMLPFADQLDNDGGDLFSMMGEEHNNDVEMTQAIAANGSVNIQNPHGDITVTTSNDGQLHLHAHQVVHTSSDTDAQKMFSAVKPTIVNSGSGALISVQGRDGVRVDLVLELPEKSFTTINAGHGDVTVESLQNNVDVTAGHGDVKCDSIGGDVHVRMSHGDFSAHQISGHAFMDGHVDDVTLSEIKGPVVIDGELLGDTHVEQIGSTLHLHSTRTDMDIPKLGGELTMDKDDLTANQASGPIRIVTRSKNIELTQVNGDTHIENSNGDVNVTASHPLGNVQITNRSGGVTLTVPENANFSVTAATTQDNDLESDFPLTMTTSGDRKTLQGMVGRATVKIDLDTSHGNLELRKGSADSIPAPPAAPIAPKAPAAPLPPGKHLKPPRNTEEAPVSQ